MASVLGCRSFIIATTVLAVVVLLQGPLITTSEPTQDKQALLKFLSDLPHAGRLHWDPSASACTWMGVQCDATNSSVRSLRLPGVGLVGGIPPDTLSRLTQLRVLSLRSNRLTGPVPPDFSRLVFLRSVYLQNNDLSGGFPASLVGLTRLYRLDLSGNNFTGPIPFAVNNLTQLTRLYLQNNGFGGKIPTIDLPNLVDFNVSDNQLNGSVPTVLAKFPSSSFANNVDLCGSPLPPCSNPFLPAPAPSPTLSPSEISSGKKKHKNLSTPGIIGLSVAGGILVMILILLLVFFLIKKLRRRAGQRKAQKPPPGAVTTSRAVPEQAGTSSSKDDVAGSAEGNERSKLVFIDGGGYSFDLEDLLRASAEVLGKGSLGTSYKAVLEEGTTVVVKRLKDVVVTKKEFEQQMEALGNIKHRNLLPLRAYYYSKDEKLLVYDYLPSGSLSALLHGSRGSGRTPLDWETRLRIAVSSARGLSYLHESGRVVHGNIKSSNILLIQDNLDSCVSDYGLNPLFSDTTPPSHRLTGYRAPEVLESRRVTFKSDVYSFGVLLLELLTGRAPNQASLGEEGIDLPRWVQSVVREEWTAEVFDVELMRHNNAEEEMVQLLQIGLACVATVPDGRPEMQHVVKMLEDVNRGDSAMDDGLRQSSDDALRGGGSDSQTPPAESRASTATGAMTP